MKFEKQLSKERAQVIRTIRDFLEEVYPNIPEAEDDVHFLHHILQKDRYTMDEKERLNKLRKENLHMLKDRYEPVGALSDKEIKELFGFE